MATMNTAAERRGASNALRIGVADREGEQDSRRQAAGGYTAGVGIELRGFDAVHLVFSKTLS